MEDYKSPSWQKKRLQILERDGWSCTFCKDAESPLQVHHRWYEPDRKLWDYPDIVFLTLCERCHNLGSKPKTELKVELDKIISKLSSNELKDILTSMWLMYCAPTLNKNEDGNG